MPDVAVQADVVAACLAFVVAAPERDFVAEALPVFAGAVVAVSVRGIDCWQAIAEAQPGFAVERDVAVEQLGFAVA